MNAVTATITVNNRPITINRFSITDIFGLVELLKSEREGEARKLAAELKLSTHDTYNVVLDIRASKPTVADVFSLCGNPQFATDVFRRGLAKGGIVGTEADDIVRLTAIGDVMDIARLLIADEQSVPVTPAAQPDGSQPTPSASEAVPLPLPAAPVSGAASASTGPASSLPPAVDKRVADALARAGMHYGAQA